MTSAEISAATGIAKTAVSAALHNAPRDMFKRAHGTRAEGDKASTLWELGSLDKTRAAAAVWAI